jgi:putative transposase
MSWVRFLKSYWDGTAATDFFFRVRLMTPRGLIRHFVLFVIDLKTRRIEIAGIVRQPNGAWVQQVAPSTTG